MTARAMMGGLALYSDGRIFALVSSDDRMFLKAGGALAEALAAEGAEQFSYRRGAGTARMGYWSLPEAALDDPDAACAWARRVLARRSRLSLTAPALLARGGHSGAAMPRKLVAGNWKMNGLAASAAMLDDARRRAPAPGCDVLICPPATLIARLAGGPFPIGGQDCHWEASGAHTGDISAEMLADAGAVAVIVGHSERRADHGETDAIGRAQGRRRLARRPRRHRLRRRDRGRARRRRHAGARRPRSSTARCPTARRPSGWSIAYEPVWAIGTGRTPSLNEIAEVHDFMRETPVATLRRGRPPARSACSTADRSSPATPPRSSPSRNVDGALVGGASLNAADFGADHRRRGLISPPCGAARPAAIR